MIMLIDLLVDSIKTSELNLGHEIMRTTHYLAVAAAFVPLIVEENPIGLINTGWDGSGILPEGSIQPNWILVSVVPANPPGGLTPSSAPWNTYVVDADYLWMAKGLAAVRRLTDRMPSHV